MVLIREFDSAIYMYFRIRADKPLGQGHADNPVIKNQKRSSVEAVCPGP